MAYFPESVIARVRDAVNIVDVVSRYVSLKKTGRSYMGLCPFHQEKTPSFSVHPEKQIYHCFGCGASGNVFKFLMEYEKITFPEAVRQLAREAGIELPTTPARRKQASENDQIYEANKIAAHFYHQCLQQAPREVHDYLAQRGLRAETVQRFLIGYAPNRWDALLQHIRHLKYEEPVYERAGLLLRSEKTGNLYDRFRHRLMFPIFSPSGRVVAFGGRALAEDPHTPKYMNSPESPVYQKSRVLYGIHLAREAIRAADQVLVVEGYMDMLQLYQSGIGNVVATSGTALTEQHAALLSRYSKKVILCYDSDTAGQKAALRGGEVLFVHGLDVKILLLPAGEDPDSFVRQQGAEAFREALTRARDYLDFLLQHYRTQFDLNLARERTTVVRQLVELLVQLSDPVLVDMYLDYIAQELQLSNSLLRNEYQKVRRAQSGRKRQPASGSASPAVVPEDSGQEKWLLQGAWAAERDLLVLLLENHPQHQETILTQVEEEDFLNPEFREAFRLLRKLPAEVRPEDRLHWLLEQLNAPLVHRMITAQLLTRLENTEKYLWDCIRQIKMARHGAEIERLRRLLIQTKEPSSPEAHHRLLSQIQQHIQAKAYWQQFRFPHKPASAQEP